VDNFIVSGPPTSPVGGDVRKDVKGKGKAVDNGKEREASCDMDVDADRMNDITNNSAFPLHDLISNKPNRTPHSR
jgi:hypothetical protein